MIASRGGSLKELVEKNDKECWITGVGYQAFELLIQSIYSGYIAKQRSTKLMKKVESLDQKYGTKLTAPTLGQSQQRRSGKNTEFGFLVNNPLYSDVKIILQNGKSFHAHKVCSFFFVLLSFFFFDFPFE